MKIETATKRLIASGDVLTFEDEPTTITLSEGGHDYAFIIYLEKDTSGKSIVNFQALNDLTLEMHFINFDHPLGVANLQPFHLGDIGGKNLYANFSISKLNDNTKIYRIIFTYYLDK